MIFKNQYYYFISGLPDFSFDSMKLPFTVEEFREMLDEAIAPEDKKLLDSYFLSYDNDNLFRLLEKKEEEELQSRGILTRADLEEVIRQVREGDTIENKQVPPYFEKAVRAWLDEEIPGHLKTLEDLISSLYADYGMGVKNSLIAGWFEMNLNIGNILSALFARKYGMDVSQVVVGNNEIAQLMRENANARDFGISRELDYYDDIIRIAEEPDIYERERKIDKFRWDWLDDNTLFDYFNIEYIFTYLCKLRILERWVSLNAEEGERVFRELIAQLKNEIQKPEDL
ncbi:MAG: DUF2764 family protein [Proteiniphilum sp.]|jgi:hypothetical protein|uniref:DUF2764 family protein n=1 Tax=Proteiniphilum sp. TaxID=1926877 RepID=UPI000929A40D|nr:DUF2764 family protein [Proteiniphilum sp.]MEA5127971.1 DUF2764 family protein [Proteiniphilum sp.]OJV81692.1 MAG: hypothetical protein BGO34_09485 [Bacteroidia bacterium 44-10]